MIEKRLKVIDDEYQQIEKMLADPAVISNTQKLKELSKRKKELFPVLDKFRKYEKIGKEISSVNTILKTDDPEMAKLAKSELSELETKKTVIESELEELLKPKDPFNKKNIIVEIRGAAGGDESALFASELYRMYTRYAQIKGFKTEVLDSSYTGIGGLKEIIFTVEGNGAYGFFKYESGTHRVQRVPKTESSGRVHTSTVTVAVLVEPEDVEVEINQSDLRIDTYRASGAGGQYVNKTSSAIRITHIPTNVVVACQDERSQLKNKLKAMKILKARLFDIIKSRQQKEIAQDRKNQVGTGDRSEKVRTYNFPQDRITDHRLNENWHNIQTILEGNLDGIVDRFKKEEVL